MQIVSWVSNWVEKMNEPGGQVESIGRVASHTRFKKLIQLVGDIGWRWVQKVVALTLIDRVLAKNVPTNLI